MSDKIDKPQQPAPSECCGGGSCCPCVWDLYFEELRQWKEQQKEQSPEQPIQPPIPDESEDFFR